MAGRPQTILLRAGHSIERISTSIFQCDATSPSRFPDQSVDRQHGVVLHGLGDDVGEVAVDTDLARQQGVDQPLVGIDVAGDDLQQIVDATADRPAGDHFRHIADRPLEPVEIAWAVIAGRPPHHPGRDRRNDTQGKPRMVAGDDAGLLQLAQPHPARRGRQTRLFGESQLGDAAVALHGVQYLQVDRVEAECRHLSLLPEPSCRRQNDGAEIPLSIALISISYRS